MDPKQRRRSTIEIVGGGILFAIGLAISVASGYVTGLLGGGPFLVAMGPMLLGGLVLARGIARRLPDRWFASQAHRTMPRAARGAVLIRLAVAVVAILAAAALTAATDDPGDRYLPTLRAAYVIAYALGGLGGIGLAISLFQLWPLPDANAVTLDYIPGIGYRLFVAWRYLLAHPHRITLRTKVACCVLVALRFVFWIAFDVDLRSAHLWFVDIHPLHLFAVASMLALVVIIFWGILRHSKVATVAFVFGVFVVLASLGVEKAAAKHMVDFLGDGGSLQVAKIASISLLCGLGFAAVVAFFGILRGFFTFFTTVPIGGVWVGTAALVLVLAVMSGFESDLRDKILGSNAHISVTREDGDFVNWREAKAKIDKIPGVVASTPFAVSEVVIAANNNGMNVIIKGIDPDTVAKVTDLVEDLEDRNAIRDLEPKIDLKRGRNIPQNTRSGTVLDPPPPDMPVPGDPIDFSGSTDAPGAGSATPPTRDPDLEPAQPFGGDARRVIDFGDDPLMQSRLLAWFVGEPDDVVGPAISIADVSREPSSRRTQVLAGILVGKELVKQTHLYVGEEVKVVSPLSDPMNPDANGTPIPYQRDYRVAGVFYTGMYEYDLKYVYVTLDSLQSFLGLGDTVDGIEVRIDSVDDTERYVPSETDPGLIREALGPGYRVQDWRELNRSLFAALKLEKIAMFLVLGIVILVASFSIVGNLIMVVVEKAREIALLKTLGASDLGVMGLFAIQGLVIGVIGTTLGVVTGLFGCRLMTEFGLPLNSDVYYIDRLPIHVDTQSVIAAAATGVVISILATIYPALLGARVRPAAGMRH